MHAARDALAHERRLADAQLIGCGSLSEPKLSLDRLILTHSGCSGVLGGGGSGMQWVTPYSFPLLASHTPLPICIR